MPTRHASAVWKGDLQQGNGVVQTESGALDGPYNFKSRFEEGADTNPEELLGAAHAACYAMFLAATLARNEFTVNSISATADVTLVSGDAGPTISEITLNVTGDVQRIDETRFLEFAEQAKVGCPVSKALGSVPTINLNAELVSQP